MPIIGEEEEEGGSHIKMGTDRIAYFCDDIVNMYGTASFFSFLLGMGVEDTEHGNSHKHEKQTLGNDTQ